MDDTMYCLVDAGGKVYCKPGAEAFDEVAREYGLNERDCQQCRFDLTTRRLLVDRGTPGAALTARAYIDQRIGTPERLITFAGEGHMPKRVLASLLATEKRPAYLDACAAIERAYTEACTARREPCLESGCSVEGEGEVCLQPVLEAGEEYDRLCAAEWAKLFRSPANRIEAWKH